MMMAQVLPLLAVKDMLPLLAVVVVVVLWGLLLREETEKG